MMCAEDRVDALTVEVNELRLMVGNARHGKHVAGEVAAELRQALDADTADAVSLPATRVRFLAEMLLGASLGVHSPASFAMSRTAASCAADLPAGEVLDRRRERLEALALDVDRFANPDQVVDALLDHIDGLNGTLTDPIG